jgi:hypothetical protein
MAAMSPEYCRPVNGWHRRSSAGSHPGGWAAPRLALFADSVAAALRYAGDNDIDIANWPVRRSHLLLQVRRSSAILTSWKCCPLCPAEGCINRRFAGNELDDLQHPDIDSTSPDWPPTRDP